MSYTHSDWLRAKEAAERIANMLRRAGYCQHSSGDYGYIHEEGVVLLAQEIAELLSCERVALGGDDEVRS